MAFLLDGKPLAVDVPFTHKDIQYPANWLRLSNADEKKAIGITEVDDPKTYDSRFYWNNGTAKALDEVKTYLKAREKERAKSELGLYDWQVVRKAEKGTELDSNVATFRDAVRTAYTTRKTEIDNCADIPALETLYGYTEKDGVSTPNMTQYPDDPNSI